MSKRTTIQDIAEKAGYSKAAVSFAFNDPSKISKEAHDRILATARELGYIPDPMARNFSRGRHMALGFLLPQMLQESLQNPYTQSVIRGIGEVCQEHGYMLTLIPPLHSSVSEAVKNATVDGLMTMGFVLSGKVRSILRIRRMPVVSIDGEADDDVHSVSIDDEKAAELQLRKVLEKGHRRIAIIALPDDAYESSSIARRRRKGYGNALSAFSIPPESIIVSSAKATFRSGMETAGRILDASSPTCFVTMSDAVAIGVMSEIRRRGLTVGDDISVMGFDGIEDSGFPCYGLSTIAQSGEEKGIRSAELLFMMIDGKEAPSSIIIPYEYREGTTLKEVKA